MSRKKTLIGECVYCGGISRLTMDHIPPRTLFAKPRPNNLIKVPCCKKCHSENPQVSQDDEYFRLMLTLREDTSNHPDVEQILPAVMRSLANNNKTGLRNFLLRNFQEVEIKTKSGIFLGVKPSYHVNLARLDHVTKRITKGLFYHHAGHRLPNEYQAVSFSIDGIRNVEENIISNLKENILLPLISTAPIVIGNHVFSYRYLFFEKDPNTSLWLYIFYSKVFFLCFTIPRTELLM